MKLFSRRHRAKKVVKDLGTGLWRQAHDRYVRGLDRYHQVIEGVADDAVHNRLVLIGDELAEQLSEVHTLCSHAETEHPAEGMHVPGPARDLHSALSKAANHLATAAEAAAMVRLGNAEVDAVRRRADQVLACVEDARRLGVA